MPDFTRDELERAFVHYWRCGAVAEDWDAWADCFTPDVTYVEHVLGTMHGRDAVRAWIKPIMAQYGELYTAYEWHIVDPDSGRVCVYMQNRRDHPGGDGTIDFPGITILRYAGDGRFDYEEDLWAVPQAQRANEAYAAACRQHDPEHAARRTRRHWGDGPAWTRGGASWAERPAAPHR
jgi:SnoaL-like domain